jgi:hypothetical protein
VCPARGLRRPQKASGVSGVCSRNLTENIVVVSGQLRAPDGETRLRNHTANSITFGVNKIALACPLAPGIRGLDIELRAKPRCLLKSIDTQITFLSLRLRIWTESPSRLAWAKVVRPFGARHAVSSARIPPCPAEDVGHGQSAEEGYRKRSGGWSSA